MIVGFVTVLYDPGTATQGGLDPGRHRSVRGWAIFGDDVKT
jgi:hypothetical protein